MRPEEEQRKTGKPFDHDPGWPGIEEWIRPRMPPGEKKRLLRGGVTFGAQGQWLETLSTGYLSWIEKTDCWATVFLTEKLDQLLTTSMAGPCKDQGLERKKTVTPAAKPSPKTSVCNKTVANTLPESFRRTQGQTPTRFFLFNNTWSTGSF